VQPCSIVVEERLRKPPGAFDRRSLYHGLLRRNTTHRPNFLAYPTMPTLPKSLCAAFGSRLARPVHPLMTLTLLLAFGAIPFVAMGAIVDDDETPDELRRGLRATYVAAGVEFARDEPLSIVLLAKDESPDARLKPGAWTATWQGMIDIQRPGRYRFYFRGNGAAELTIDGQPTPLLALDAQPAVEAGLNLTFGPHPVVVRFTPKAGEASRLELLWESDSFEREAIPARSFAHPANEPSTADPFFHGRLQVEEHSCVACHQKSDKLPMSAQLSRRPGPKLTGAASRLKAAWIYHWLADPAAFRAEAIMPKLFGDDETGRVERYAVTQFLAAQGTPLEIIADPPQPVVSQTVADGALLFDRVGCAVCHTRQGDRPAAVTLKNLAHKTTPEGLEEFIRNPGSIAPAGRMPSFVLGKLEVRQLAMHLSHQANDQTAELSLPEAPPSTAAVAAFDAMKPSAPGREAFLALAPAEQWKSLGREVMQAKRCASCHEIKEAGEKTAWKAEPNRFDLAAVADRPGAGCIAPIEASEPSAAPRFGANMNREAIATFLKAAIAAPATSAPGENARLAIERFNCQGCHERSGVGGLSPEMLNRLGSGDTAAAETQTPPSLTQVTGKLTHKAMTDVLEAHERTRPWMHLQMPRFAKEHVHDLPQQFAALDGQPLVDAPKPPKPAEDNAAPDPLAEAGRTLVGNRGFGCIKCHDMLGVPSSGTRGPDLAKTPARVQQAWYHRWMKDPQRIQPGTRMPTIFLEGKSPFKEILDGNPARQREAIWNYLTVASSMAAPEGLEEVKLQTLVADSKPLVVRTFLNGTTPRGIATRFPNQVHAAFDAQMGRMAFAWSGEFLDMGPVWNGRGGNPAHVLGKIFWTAPAGCPWEITPAEASPPSFAGRAEDGSLGALLKDSKLHPARYSFGGYSLSAFGPTFRYRIAAEDGKATLTVAEHLDTLKAEAGQGVLRELKLGIPRGRSAWLHIVESDTEPTLMKAAATAPLSNEKQAAEPTSLIRVEQAGQPLLLRVRRSSGAADWISVRSGERYSVLLRVEPSREEEDTELDLALWRPADNEPETWRKLIAEELK